MKNIFYNYIWHRDAPPGRLYGHSWRNSLLIFLALIISANPSTVLAYLSTDAYTSNDTGEYVDARAKEPTAACTATGSGNVNLVGGDNVQKSYNFFVDSARGLSPAQAAGIVGNLMLESTQKGIVINPNALNASNHYGIAQWDTGRTAAMKKFVPDSWQTLEGQLGYLWHEVTDPKNAQVSVFHTLDDLKSTNTPEAAAASWEKTFERSGGSGLSKRKSNAKSVFDKYGGSATASTPNGTSSGDPSCTTSGSDTKFVDGFTIYSQYDPAWKDTPYPPTTIGEGGCGPSAMAMIITNLTGNKVTPVDTSNYAASQGLHESGGSKHNIGKVLAEHWGLKSELIGSDLSKINQALNAGGLVIAAGKGALPFSTGGHFIVIRGVTSDGKWKVGDSGHNNTSDKEWDPQQIISEINVNNGSGSVYAIYK
jgi:hypothetical protein